MQNPAGGYEYVINLVIVEFGMGSRILKEAKKAGVTGGTIFLGRGTVRNPILRRWALTRQGKRLFNGNAPRPGGRYP